MVSGVSKSFLSVSGSREEDRTSWCSIFLSSMEHRECSRFFLRRVLLQTRLVGRRDDEIAHEPTRYPGEHDSSRPEVDRPPDSTKHQQGKEVETVQDNRNHCRKTEALAQADASLVSPLLTFNPAFTLFIAFFALGEIPGLHQSIAVLVILGGAYVLEVEQARTGLLAPLRVLVYQPGTAFAVLASALWGTTPVLEKFAINHMSPPSGPFVALLGTAALVLLLTPST